MLRFRGVDLNLEDEKNSSYLPVFDSGIRLLKKVNTLDLIHSENEAETIRIEAKLLTLQKKQFLLNIVLDK